jgi:hypothetical protein
MTDQLRALDHLYLEDSYLLGMIADGGHLRFRILFALTGDHPSYRPPLPKEQHCYRRGDVIADNVTILSQRSGARPHITSDPDGSLDFGSVEFQRKDGSYFFVSEWLELEFTAMSVRVEFEKESGHIKDPSATEEANAR